MTDEEREAVFEQAHTPASDEREALARLLDGHWMTPLGKCACGWVHPQYGSRHLDPLYVRHHIADAILAAGFRCTVQGEPTDATVTTYERAAAVARSYSSRPGDIADHLDTEHAAENNEREETP